MFRISLNSTVFSNLLKRSRLPFAVPTEILYSTHLTGRVTFACKNCPCQRQISITNCDKRGSPAREWPPGFNENMVCYVMVMGNDHGPLRTGRIGARLPWRRTADRFGGRWAGSAAEALPPSSYETSRPWPAGTGTSPHIAPRPCAAAASAGRSRLRR